MIDEGYVKFRCDWTPGPPPAADLLDGLDTARQLMVESRLIGHDRTTGVDYGNISIRAPNPGQMIITGTQTGHLARLSARHYVLVTACDIATNRVHCTGAIQASSETLTHAAIYALNPEIQAIIHAHQHALWERLVGEIPTTAADVAYGTPQMAEELQRLYRATDLPTTRLAAMGGHPDGLISFGATLTEAAQRLLNALHAD